MNADRVQQIHQTAELLFDADSVAEAIAAIALEVENESKQDFPLVLCVMNGVYRRITAMRHSEKVVLSLQESLFFSRIWGSGSERVLVWSDLCGRGGNKEGLTGFSVDSARADH